MFISKLRRQTTIVSQLQKVSSRPMTSLSNGSKSETLKEQTNQEEEKLLDEHSVFAEKAASKSTSKISQLDSGTSQQQQKKQSELDDQLRSQMANLAGDGGEAGVELEGGKAVSMKRSVKNNMFRYI